MLVDTHCHIHDKQFFASPTNPILARMHENGVEKCITIGTDPEDSANACKYANEHDEVWWTFGYHPNDYDGDKARLEADLAAAKPILEDKRLVAIGEIGLDYHFDGYNKEFQRYLLENMLQIAQDHQLPVSFHIREAFEDFWPIVENFRLPTSVLHSYSDSKKNMKIGLEKGFYFGVNGLATFADIVHPPLERILFETDAPFLTPAPFRGKINEPGYVKHIAEWAAGYYQQDLATISEITTENATKIFKI
jgi:TatD DNase family protein